MNFLRKHWYDLGGILAIILIGYVFFNYQLMSDYQIVMWISLISLFFHQLEEYRVVGTFPGMINSVMFKSETPDRFPLNTNTAFYINVFLGWGVYFLAAVFAEKAIWLGITSILVSVGNTIAHTFLFNIKGKTFYNAGMLTTWFLFVPVIYFFFHIIHSEHLVTATDYWIGIPLGVVLNYVGILKVIDWASDKNTPYIFEKRNML
ncbi:MAG: HXXEE domain-containing protein [Crocinitomicaceae bacterium]